MWSESKLISNVFMALLKYFHAVPRSSDTSDCRTGQYSTDNLPDPAGPLSSDLPPSVIAAANDAVASACQTTRQKKRGPYVKLSSEVKAKIGKYASENGDSSAARHFSKVCASCHVILNFMVYIYTL